MRSGLPAESEVRIPVTEQAKPRKIEVRKVEIAQADDKQEIAA